MKECKQCLKTLPLSEFYSTKTGKFSKCKECIKKNVKQNREEKEEYYKAYDRNRPNKAERNKLNIERQKTEKGKAIHNNACRAWGERNKDRRQVQIAVSNAVRDGRLQKLPCFICGEAEVEGHHPNYDAPLDVIWLCVKHHKEIHTLYDKEQDARILAETKKGSRCDNDTNSI